VDIAMLHIAEDFRMKFVPTAQDYLKNLDVSAVDVQWCQRLRK
jgi:hypothetical protein